MSKVKVISKETATPSVIANEIKDALKSMFPRKEVKDVKFMVVIPEENHRKLKLIAQNGDTSITSIINQLIDDFLGDAQIVKIVKTLEDIEQRNLSIPFPTEDTGTSEKKDEKEAKDELEE
ncbi:MAG: hypothetical protein IJQ57_04860 [Synergistaceae bacterium]|nr:hypothetical protein [Synergistaceae bacterium]MBR0252665.1 hypothetical protein [Synergistaceae bacterium]